MKNLAYILAGIIVVCGLALGGVCIYLFQTLTYERNFRRTAAARERRHAPKTEYHEVIEPEQNGKSESPVEDVKITIDEK